MPLPPRHVAFQGSRPVELELDTSTPQLRVFTRPHLNSPAAPMAPSATADDPDQDPSSNGQPNLQRKKTQHDEKGDFYRCDYRCNVLTVLIVGASGDLAKKKTYPSLFALFKSNYLPEDFTIVGYARSAKSDSDFRASIKKFLISAKSEATDSAAHEASVDAFLAHCIYRNGKSYDDEDAIRTIHEEVEQIESVSATSVNATAGALEVNRLFYFAIPPAVFVSITRVLKKFFVDNSGWSRFIIEKPFGNDLASFEALNNDISSLLTEKEMFRIDHYIGKEAVQNLLVMRFANNIFEPVWNRHFVSSVVISFKENFGTKGRGGYFDKTGIIRDVMQNHLTQVLTMFAMESPIQSTGDAIRDEKVKVLKAIKEIRVEDCITGQYIADDDGVEEDYTADSGVPNDSKTPTFAGFVMYIDNPRWEGVPIIMRAGKALNERKSEIRIQFKKAPASRLLFPDIHNHSPHGLERNELVMRLQPNEAVYLKMNIKSPGLSGEPVLSELDLSYRTRYPDKFSALPDAYTRLILQVLRGDSSAFVRDDELREAWRIFTPLLHAIDQGAIEPIKYKAFSRGPKEFDQMTAKYGYIYAGDAYNWENSENGDTSGGKARL